MPLYWLPEFWRVRDRLLGRQFQAMSQGGEQIFFQVRGNVIRVPGAATFGGWWNPQKISQTVEACRELYLGLFKLFPDLDWEVTLPPDYFHPAVFLPQERALLELGAVPVVDTGSVVYLEDKQLSEPGAFLPKPKRKQLRGFLRHGGDVRIAFESEWETAYALLAANRAQRSVSLSITFSQFSSYLSKFPSIYKCYLAIASGQIVGVSLTVEISRDTTYVFYWGDSPSGREIGAVTGLYAHIVEETIASGKQFLDLGKSSLEGVIDDGLATFKRRLGARDTQQKVLSIAGDVIKGMDQPGLETPNVVRLN